MKLTTGLSLQKPLARDQYLQIVNAAIVTERFRFARDLIIKWLGSYPGDLKAGQYYAKALIGMGQKQQAIQILRGLCMADPEDKAAAEALLYALSPLHEDLVLDSDELTYLFLMADKKIGLESLASWGNPLLSARTALESGDLAEAESFISNIRDSYGRHALLAVIHLRILTTKKDDSSHHFGELAENYHNLFPDCLACTLIYGDYLMKAGKPDLAVAIIHQVAARDVGGQVISRLWGVNHPYRSLWLKKMEMKLETPIPAIVATALGRNRLYEGYDAAKFSSEVDTAEILGRGGSVEEYSPKIASQDDNHEEKVLSDSLNNLSNQIVGSEDRVQKGEDTQPIIILRIVSPILIIWNIVKTSKMFY